MPQSAPNDGATIETGSGTIAVLVASREPTDREQLSRVLPEPKWRLHAASDFTSALRQLRRHKEIALIVCDRLLWKEMVASAAELRARPLVIVAARDADERLWAEALNIGAYDVLAKPFEASEVVRSLCLGWLYWRRENDRRSLLAKPRTIQGIMA